MKNKELIEIAHKAHELRMELGIDKMKSQQSLDIELEHIENSLLSDGRKSK